MVEADAAYRRALSLNPAYRGGLHWEIAETMLLRGETPAALAESERNMPVVIRLALRVRTHTVRAAMGPQPTVMSPGAI